MFRRSHRSGPCLPGGLHRPAHPGCPAQHRLPPCAWRTGLARTTPRIHARGDGPVRGARSTRRTGRDSTARHGCADEVGSPYRLRFRDAPGSALRRIRYLAGRERVGCTQERLEISESPATVLALQAGVSLEHGSRQPSGRIVGAVRVKGLIRREMRSRPPVMRRNQVQDEVFRSGIEPNSCLSCDRFVITFWRAIPSKRVGSHHNLPNVWGCLTSKQGR
jgi:hypothetical protein